MYWLVYVLTYILLGLFMYIIYSLSLFTYAILGCCSLTPPDEWLGLVGGSPKASERISVWAPKTLNPKP